MEIKLLISKLVRQRIFLVALVVVVAWILVGGIVFAVIKRRPALRATPVPSNIPTVSPSQSPSFLPSSAPSRLESAVPTSSPTGLPSSTPSLLPSSGPTMADLIVEPNPVPSNPENMYFNYNLTDSKYGPEEWGDLDTSDSPMKEFTNSSGWGTWKGHLAERDPTKNRCRYRDKQSPLDLYQTQGVQEAICDAPHQIRSRPATFRLSSDKVTKTILPHKLSLVMNRRPCRDLDLNLCSQGRPPLADYPRYSSGLSQFSDLLNFDIKIPGEHWIEGEQFDAEIQMLHTHLDSSRVSSIGVPVRARADGFNAEFQAILDQFQRVYDWDKAACDVKDFSDQQAENSTTPVVDPDLNRRLQVPEPMFNPYSEAIMTTLFFYRYDGTTTEPPCTYLTWWVMSSPMIISLEQLHQAKYLLFTHVNRDCEKTSVHNSEMSVARPLQKQADDQYIQKCKEGDFEADGPATRF